MHACSDQNCQLEAKPQVPLSSAQVAIYIVEPSGLGAFSKPNFIYSGSTSLPLELHSQNDHTFLCVRQQCYNLAKWWGVSFLVSDRNLVTHSKIIC